MYLNLRRFNFMKASELIPLIQNKTGSSRERDILDAINKDAIPEFLKTFAEITIQLGNDKLQYYVSKDYFAIGEDDDYLLIPVFVATIKPVLQKLDCSLPTVTMVKQIYQHADVKIPAHPQRWNPGESITATRLYVAIDQAIKRERTKLGAGLDKLIAGHKKDVVLSNAILKQAKPNRIAIYGWNNPDGSVIQGLNPKDHDIGYVDYSHGFRLVKNKCLLNGVETTLKAIWDHPTLCHLLHDEPLKFQSY